MALAEEHCAPCESGVGKLTEDEVTSFLTTVPSWKREQDGIQLKLKFPNFKTALAFVDQIGELAEKEGHHPDIAFGWGYVHITLTTHSVKGLTRNDFVMASKIDALSH